MVWCIPGSWAHGKEILLQASHGEVAGHGVWSLGFSRMLFGFRRILQSRCGRSALRTHAMYSEEAKTHVGLRFRAPTD